jgi:FkbM family methyltransferase
MGALVKDWAIMSSKLRSFFSQNFEDVLLARVLSDISIGFYIDVGCQDECLDSVTRYFYDRGWNGINIDPVKEYHDQYQKNRPRDINVCCAIGSSEGTADLYVAQNCGLSTLLSSRAVYAATLGVQVLPARTVRIRQLNSILAEHLPEHTRISFLKIDVEGKELDVLKGLDMNVFRPIILVIETTKPNTSTLVDDYEAISSLLSDNHYDKVYFDGINTWWLAHEERERKSLFEYPIGIFDGFSLNEIRHELLRLDGMINDLAVHKQQQSPFRRLARKLKRLGNP